MKSYYYLDSSEEVVGPFKLSDLDSIYQDGSITGATQVCEEGTQNWMPFFKVPRPTAPQQIPTAVSSPDINLPSSIPKTAGLATASLVCGITSLFLLLLTGIPAVITGHMALGKIKKSQGRLQGSGKAITGLILGYISIALTLIAVLAGLATPAILGAKKDADKAKTITNAKIIGIAMTEFDNQYGEFPSDLTRKELESEGEEVPSGDSANDYFAQLLINKSTDSEKIFYAKGVRGVKEGDNVFKNQPDKILEKSEVGFGYFMYDDNTPLSLSDASSCPLICAPLKSGGTNPIFDENAYAGEYVYLQLDNSVVTGKIKDGKALLKNQGMKTITTTGEGSMWETAQPVVKPPAAIQ